MLSDFKDKQLLAYNLFVKDIENNCVTHAYLIDENNYSDSFKFILSFVKSILCDNKFTSYLQCDSCSLCKKIDDGNYPELKIIEADGMYIKKQQIIDLQQEFSRSSVYGKKRIYIIKDCEKMKAETANSMLKFLEEPQSDIIAILMTNNINNVLSTIISRCKVIKLSNTVNEEVIVDTELEDIAIDFVISLEKKGLDMLFNVKDFWFSKIGSKDRDKMVIVFDMMIDIYYDMMKMIMGSLEIKCNKWKDKIISLSKLNNLDDVLEKIRILIEAKDSVKFNVNSNLLIDSIIISIGGRMYGSRY